VPDARCANGRAAASLPEIHQHRRPGEERRARLIARLVRSTSLPLRFTTAHKAINASASSIAGRCDAVQLPCPRPRPTSALAAASAAIPSRSVMRGCARSSAARHIRHGASM